MPASARTSCPGWWPWCWRCAAWLVWQAATGGYRAWRSLRARARADWVALAWVAAGVLANAALITTHRLHPQPAPCASCSRCAGCACPRASRTVVRGLLRSTCDRLPDRRAGLLAVHQAAGHQSAGPHRHGLAVSGLAPACLASPRTWTAAAGLCHRRHADQPAVGLRRLRARHGHRRAAGHRPGGDGGHAAAHHRRRSSPPPAMIFFAGIYYGAMYGGSPPPSCSTRRARPAPW
jgi:hypothetical protein